MALRIIEAVIGADGSDKIEDILKDHPFIDLWRLNSKDGKDIVKILLDAERTGEMLNALSNAFSGSKDFRIVLLPLEATLPEEDARDKKKSKSKEFGFLSRAERLSIEELFSKISDISELNMVYLTLVVLSTFVAAFGILKGSNIMIVGAMVIAPLLGPNMALSLGTTLGDFNFIKKSSLTSLSYIFAALAVSVIIGLILKPAPGIGVIKDYSSSQIGDIILSLAAGAAGALSLTIGLSTILIGVTISLAVLPSLVTLGIMIGAGNFNSAYGALFLFLTNIICINLSGVLTFLARGIHPVKYWQEKKARRATAGAIILWVTLLAALILLIVIQKF